MSAPVRPVGRFPSWMISLAAGAVVFSLVALLLSPLVTGRWKRAHREQVVEWIVPAGDQVDDLTLTLSRTVAALRGHLLTGSDSFRSQLLDAREEKERILLELTPYVDALDADIRDELDELREADRRWSAPVNRYLAGELSRDEMVARLIPQQLLYLRLLESAERLSWRLSAESERHLDAIGDLELLESALGVLLVLLALLSTVVVILLARRLLDQAVELEEQADAAAMQKERAEEAVRARDEVLAIVAHDLRTPLNAIRGSAALVLGEDLDRESRLRQLDVLRRSADRMNRLIQDLLDVARFESGRVQLTLRPEAPAALLEELEGLFASEARARAIQFRSAARDDVHPVSVDRDRLLQALTNLVHNAFKFTPDGGCVTVSAESGEDAVLFRVADTGPGIPEDDRAEIFRRFWQGRRSDRGGAGLGLAIARGVVEAHGGTITVGGRLDEGAVFEVAIPCLAVPSRGLPPPADASRPGRVRAV